MGRWPQPGPGLARAYSGLDLETSNVERGPPPARCGSVLPKHARSVERGTSPATDGSTERLNGQLTSSQHQHQHQHQSQLGNSAPFSCQFHQNLNIWYSPHGIPSELNQASSSQAKTHLLPATVSIHKPQAAHVLDTRPGRDSAWAMEACDELS